MQTWEIRYGRFAAEERPEKGDGSCDDDDVEFDGHGDYVDCEVVGVICHLAEAFGLCSGSLASFD